MPSRSSCSTTGAKAFALVGLSRSFARSATQARPPFCQRPRITSSYSCRVEVSSEEAAVLSCSFMESPPESCVLSGPNGHNNSGYTLNIEPSPERTGCQCSGVPIRRGTRGKPEAGLIPHLRLPCNYSASSVPGRDSRELKSSILTHQETDLDRRWALSAAGAASSCDRVCSDEPKEPFPPPRRPPRQPFLAAPGPRRARRGRGGGG